MFTLRGIIGSAIAAIFTGAVGFGSAYFLQAQASADRERELRAAHELEMERAETALRAAEVQRRQDRTNAFYVELTTDPLKSRARAARYFLERNPGSYPELAARFTPQQLEPLDAVIGYWSRVNDWASSDRMDLELARNILGPDAAYWGTHMPRLLAGIDRENPAPQFGGVVLAARGVEHLGGSTQQASTGVQTAANDASTPESRPPLARAPAVIRPPTPRPPVLRPH